MSVHTLVIETAFSDDEATLAKISQHLCPTMLEDEFFRDHIQFNQPGAQVPAPAASPAASPEED